MSNPRNISRIKTLIIIILVAFSCYLLHSNANYEWQLMKYTNQINRLQVKDSIYSQYFEILDNDSLYILPRVVCHNGSPMTYSQLDSIIGILDHKVHIQQMIIDESQSIFKYQYTITENDSMIHLKMKYQTWEIKPEFVSNTSD